MNNAAQNVELPMEFYAEDLSSLMKRTEDRRGLIGGSKSDVSYPRGSAQCSLLTHFQKGLWYLRLGITPY